MPAQILKPRAGDTLKVTVGGNAPVSVFYDYAALSNLQCFVEADHDPPAALNGPGTHPGLVPYSKVAGNYIVTVRVETNGAIDDSQHPVTKRVLPALTALTAERANPPAAGQRPPAG